jgi:hypothetical protein
MTDIDVWIAVEPNGHRIVRTVAKDKKDCKNLARDHVVKGTRSTAPLWTDLKSKGWSVQPYILTKRTHHD